MKNYFKYISLAIAVLCLGGLLAGFYFLYATILTSGEKTNQILAEVENETARREEIKLINKSIDTIKQDRDVINTHFAHSTDIVPFLNTIESLAPRAGAKVETSSVDALKDDTGLMVRLKVEGSFNSIYKFLMLLENSPYELDFSELIIDRVSEVEITPIEQPTQTEEGLPMEAPEPIVRKDPKWQGVITVKLLSFIK